MTARQRTEPTADPHTAGQLEVALRSFERHLAAAGGDPGPGQWPPLTDDLRAAVHLVRDLRAQLADRKDLWLRRPCGYCGGHGVQYDLHPEDEDRQEWFRAVPCRPCLSTGLTLRLPAPSHG
jgi:hypothetical protein